MEAPFEDIKRVTHEMGIKAFIEKEYMETLQNSSNRICKFINSISKKYIEFSYDKYKVKGLCAPDPITISSIIDPSIVTYIPCKIKINLKTRGTCKIDLVENSNIKIANNIDLEKFRKLFKNTFKI